MCFSHYLLWFAFILLSLSYWQQLIIITMISRISCDLLSFYYLCRTDNNWEPLFVLRRSVVICFHFTIFVVLTTTFRHVVDVYHGCDLLSFYYLCRTDNNFFTLWQKEHLLWFAFILLSLSYWQQRFALLLQVGVWLWFAFILLSLSYWQQH